MSSTRRKPNPNIRSGSKSASAASASGSASGAGAGYGAGAAVGPSGTFGGNPAQRAMQQHGQMGSQIHRRSQQQQSHGPMPPAQYNMPPSYAPYESQQSMSDSNSRPSAEWAHYEMQQQQMQNQPGQHQSRAVRAAGGPRAGFPANPPQNQMMPQNQPQNQMMSQNQNQNQMMPQNQNQNQMPQNPQGQYSQMQPAQAPRQSMQHQAPQQQFPSKISVSDAMMLVTKRITTLEEQQKNINGGQSNEQTAQLRAEIGQQINELNTMQSQLAERVQQLEDKMVDVENVCFSDETEYENDGESMEDANATDATAEMDTDNDPVQRAKDDIEQMKQQILETQKAVDTDTATTTDVSSKPKIAYVAVDTFNHSVNTLTQANAAANSRIKSLEGQVTDLTKKLTELKPIIDTMMSKMAKS